MLPAGACTRSCDLLPTPARPSLPARSLAAELGARGAAGPGSLRVGLLDQLWMLSEQQLLEGAKVRE